jgi:3-oxoacyl-[acyl-carrier protein] reductase
MRFAGKTIFMTGASGGLGRAMTEAFAAEGGWVAIGHRVRSEDAGALLDRIGGAGMSLPFDVTRDDDVQKAVEKVIEARGRIDVLVNSAAVADDQPFALMDSASFQRVIEINLTGTFRACKAVSRTMLRHKSGSIVNMASVSGLRASPGQANYVSAKGGVVSLTQTLAAELGPSGIRVNAVVPGLIAAGMVEKMPHKAIDRRKVQIPLGRLGTASELARAVLFLASDDASYVTGHALVVDGGLSV